jgi:hypothetical protein
MRVNAAAFAAAFAAVATLGALSQAPAAPFAAVEEHVPYDYRPLLALDVDTDGDLDLLAREGVLQNDGTGRFSPVVAPPLLVSVLFVSVSTLALDVDGDGFDDLLAVAPDASSTLQFFVFRSGPTGLVALPTVTFPAPAAPLRLQAVDYDEDGFDDLVVGMTTTSVLTVLTPGAVWRNVLGTAFVDATPNGVAPLGLAAGYPIAAGDFDGDGKRDVLGMGFPNTGVFLWTPSGGTLVGSVAVTTGGPTPHNATYSGSFVGDFDGDGADDAVLFCSGVPTIYDKYGFRAVAGQPTIQPIAQVAATLWGSYGSRAAACDLDDDGVDELIVSRGQSVGNALHPTMEVVADVFGAAPTTAASFVNGPKLLLTFDADGDGDRDVLAVRGGRTPRLFYDAAVGGLYEARGDLNFEALEGFAPGRQETILGDFDGDGDVDAARPIASNCTGGPFAILDNDGRGRFAPSTIPFLCVASVPADSVASDFDGDGRVDIVRASEPAASSPPSTTVVHHRSVPGGWIDATLGVEAGSVRSILAFDAGQDGDEDVLVAMSSPGALVLYENVDGAFQRTAIHSGGQLTEARVADLTGDGVPDYVYSEIASAGGATANLVRLINGATSTVPAIVGNGERIGVGDFDGDGDVDLLLDATVRINLGGGFFTAGQTVAGLPAAAAGPFLPTEILDANDDGDPDVLAYGALALGGPGASFGAALTAPFPAINVVQTGVMPRYRAVDLDRDGDLDLLDPSSRLLANVTRHLALGSPAAVGRTGSLEAYGPPLQPCDVFVSFNAFEQSPIAVPGWGNLFLVPEASVYVGSFDADATGRAVVPFVVPNDSALVGLTLQCQAALPVVGKLTNAETVRILAL